VKRLSNRIARTKFPLLSRPAHPLGKVEEYAPRELKSFLNRMLSLCLFDMFIAEVRPALKYNEYWGYCEYLGRSNTPGLTGTYLAWPAVIALEPDDRSNEAHNWRSSHGGS
jgi:hypothetical protein